MNPQAETLNKIIKEESETVYELLSEKGKNIFYPKKGILAQSEEAKGKKINATIGSAIENDATSMCLDSIVRLVNLNQNSIVSYAPSFGNPEIRKKWLEMMREKNASLKDKHVSTPMTTAALTHALSILGYLFIDEGESLCFSDLHWENYDLIFANAYGAVFDTFPLFEGGSFAVNSFRAKIMSTVPRNYKIILNFPNNPSGYTPLLGEAAQIVSAIKESAELGNKILVIIDDAYFNLVYEDGVERQSLFAYLCDIHENVLAVKVDGPTKEDYVWGFRVGFVTYGIKNGSRKLYEALEQKTGGVIRGTISNVPNISQSLLLAAYNSPEYDREKKSKYNILRSRYTAVKTALAQNSEYSEYFSAMPFNSGYFMCIRLAEGIDVEAVRLILLNDFSVGVINLDNLIRIAFSAVPTDVIPELFNNLFLACKKAVQSS
ncbi:MAG: aminotransferase class I/II-fold pyridoxal phosphate-dependent enzyme [Leptospirales bacterium]|nr:aminotransferase class I/II-fold pyridoxal phosphate-dependent enzyme [Leptospirales bacterium]